MAGEWEFPGGKVQAGELPLHALKRELGEELGIVVSEAEPFLRQSHRYPELEVHLDCWWVLGYEGEVQPLESQVLRWVAAAELDRFPLLPADAPIVTAIRERLLG